MAENQNSKTKLWCLCLKPSGDDRGMIKCDRCSNWYHFSCVGMTQNEESIPEETFDKIAKTVDKWICSLCTRLQTVLLDPVKLLLNDINFKLTEGSSLLGSMDNRALVESNKELTAQVAMLKKQMEDMELNAKQKEGDVRVSVKVLEMENERLKSIIKMKEEQEVEAKGREEDVAASVEELERDNECMKSIIKMKDEQEASAKEREENVRASVKVLESKIAKYKDLISKKEKELLSSSKRCNELDAQMKKFQRNFKDNKELKSEKSNQTKPRISGSQNSRKKLSLGSANFERSEHEPLDDFDRQELEDFQPKRSKKI